MKHAQLPAYELTTTLRVDHQDETIRRDFVAALEDAVFEATGDHPAVTAFFVAPHADNLEVEIGLRFENVASDMLDEWASEILDDALSRIGRSKKRSDSAKTAVVETQLVLA